jgi:hypothetical protein
MNDIFKDVEGNGHGLFQDNGTCLSLDTGFGMVIGFIEQL